MLVGAGYAKAGNTTPTSDHSDVIGLWALRAAGYNVLTWDPRGLGGSGGSVMFDSPDYEARDVQALLDYVAGQPIAQLDGPGDPRVGMSGFSYGAGIQFVSAAIDPRIDAIAPDAGWHSLLSGFFKDGAVKTGIASVCAGGEASSVLGGLLPSSAGPQLGGTAAALRRACVEAVGGGLSATSRQWFAARGPGDLVRRIRAPTLILQATTDATFPPSEAIANYDILRANDVPVKMIWYCGGHGPCSTGGATPGGDGRRVARAALAWFDRWLKQDAAVDTGPRFEWIADDAAWRSGPDYPLAPASTLETAGAASLVVSPLASATSGALTYAAPAIANTTNIGFPPPPDGSDLIGEPVVRLSYRGNAVPARTFLYGQIVDTRAGRVLGVQVTPIPVVLDGRDRSVTRPLEPIAARGGRASQYRLQITAGSNVYGVQRSTGSVRLRAQASLPLVDATRSGRQEQQTPIVRTMPRRLRIAVSSARRAGGVRRLVLRSRLRSRPCSGEVRFTVRAAGRTRAYTAPVSVRTCAVRKVVRLKLRSGRRVRVSARFGGNATLLPRRAVAVTHRAH